ncbi:GDP-fucose transporter 1 [Nasonia vitripennis]|uniref:Sugar phosphate transporter domain-containing protein n=1 Tax=Nasonia vitripennis TaxID=7425 RepID=A0A7M7LJJ0_NASVI|nr:GDP-fucose transporter 1 [Nasonia vitripennis]XP_016843767.1 GDP-fucose transporter 1 [Nasonia vitripennis]
MYQRREMLHKYMYVAFVVALYWVVSILMVFVNKALLSSEKVHLNAPLFITWFQCVTSVGICVSLKAFAKIFPQYFYFPKGTPFSWDVIRKVLPLSILFIGMIASNNLCLKYVGVAFYYIGRSLTTVFNVIFTYLILGEKTSSKTVTCCVVIIFGFWLGVDQENIAGSLSITGTFFGVLGSLTLSLYSIHTKKVLPVVNQEIWLLSYYNNIYSVVLFLPLMLINGEFNTVYNYDKIGDLDFWSAMIVGGLCGFAIGYVTMLQIKVTSPLTHNISGTAKACVQTVLATHWYNESKPFLWWLSNFIVLLASAAYARIKQLSMKQAFAKQVSVIKT